MKNTIGQPQFVEKCRKAHNEKQSYRARWEELQIFQESLGEEYKPLKIIKGGLKSRVLQRYQSHCPSCKEKLDKTFIGGKEGCYDLYMLTCTCAYEYAAHGDYYPGDIC